MSISENSKAIDNKIEQSKAQYTLGRETTLLRFLLYHQEMLVNMNF